MVVTEPATGLLMSRKVIDKGWNIGCLLPFYEGVDFTFKTKRPEEYEYPFIGDVMLKEYKNVLWNEHELVFIKQNRIDTGRPEH